MKARVSGTVVSVLLVSSGGVHMKPGRKKRKSLSPAWTISGVGPAVFLYGGATVLRVSLDEGYFAIPVDTYRYISRRRFRCLIWWTCETNERTAVDAALSGHYE
jgi:hypothetical protein